MEPKKPIEMMSQEEYIKNGLQCPRCRSFSIDWHENLEANGDEIIRKVHCNSCNLIFTEFYQLGGYEIINE